MQRTRERRRFARLSVSCPMRYRDLNNGSRISKDTLIKNVSEGGVRFSTDRFISLERRLLLELRLPSIDKLIRAVSKVVWIKKLPTGDDYEVGNKFLTISKEDQKIISKAAADQTASTS